MKTKINSKAVVVNHLRDNDIETSVIRHVLGIRVSCDFMNRAEAAVHLQ